MEPLPDISKQSFKTILEQTNIRLNWRRKLNLRRKLRLVKRGYENFKDRATYPPPSQQSKELEKIAKAARRLMAACWYDGSSPNSNLEFGPLANELLGSNDTLHRLPKHLKWALSNSLKDNAEQHGKRALATILEGIHVLEQAAHAAIVEQQNEVGKKAPHLGDIALDFTVWYMAQVYQEVYGREPSVNRTGPFARFLAASLSEFGEHRNKATRSSLSQRWSRIRKSFDPNL